MKKTIVIGDIHGRDIWKRIVNEEQYDRVIFIGDYFDSFNIPGDVQINNFRDIIAFKEGSNNEVILLIGNHDFHYMRECDERYSGYQKDYRFLIEGVIADNRHHLRIAHQIGNMVFTHAGISKTWYREWKEFTAYPFAGYMEIAGVLEDLFNHKPKAFKFHGNDYYGNDFTQGPLWIRPEKLIHDKVDGLVQVVGHTRMKAINPGSEESGCWFIDVLDYSNQYLMIEQGVIEIRKLAKIPEKT